MRAYVGGLTALALALAACWGYVYGLEFEPRFIVGAAVFSALILLGEVFPIRVSEETAIGAWDVGLVVAIATVGPDWAAVAVLPAALYTGRGSPLRTAFEVGHGVVVVYLAGVFFSFASAPLLYGTTTSTAGAVYGTLAVGATLILANRAIMAAPLKIKYGRSLREPWREDTEPYPSRARSTC